MAHDRKLHPAQQKIFDILLKDPRGETRNKKMGDAISHLRNEPVRLSLDEKNSSGEAAGETALHIAIKQQDREIEQQLIAGGADVNFRLPWGTPLISAAWHGNLEIASDLVAAKADPNIQNNFEYHQHTALMTAVSNSNYNAALVKLLLENKADPNIKDRFSKTALDHALYHRWVDGVSYVSLLLEHKADFQEERILYFLRTMSLDHTIDLSNPKVRYCLGVLAEKKSEYKEAISHYEAGSSYPPAQARANELKRVDLEKVPARPRSPGMWSQPAKATAQEQPSNVPAASINPVLGCN